MLLFVILILELRLLPVEAFPLKIFLALLLYFLIALTETVLLSSTEIVILPFLGIIITSLHYFTRFQIFLQASSTSINSSSSSISVRS
jgi:hypothetical protein